ncbi:MAG: hypothetical protein Q8L74_01745 [Nitrospirota bacterium]|nr:hypothetical protein [Nitrospirota bacterium]
MKQIFKVTLVFASILTAAFSTDAMAARKQSPTDQLSQALKQAGLKEVENEVVRQLGQAIEVGAPLRLDHRTAFPPTTVPIDNFHPKKLEFTPETMNQPLEPGDYTLDVIGHCTRWSLHYPGRGLAYKLARLQGRQAEVISELYHRGTQQGIPPFGLHAMAWRIQGGVPLKHWRSREQELVHQLIPEYESSLQGDYLEQIREIYSKAATLGKLPRYETMLSRMGPVGETVIELQRARKILANKTLAAERMPELLYGRPRDGLPRTLTGGPNDPPSSWSEIAPGVFARLTIIRGNLGRNVLDLRVAPQDRIPPVSHHPRNTFAILPVALMAQMSPERSWTFEDLMKYISGLIGYPEGRPAQALILAPKVFCTGINDCGFIGIRG